MKKNTPNFIVDLVSFIVLLCIFFTGVIMKYILPPGSGGRGYGYRGGAEADRVRQFISMTRHEWGSVHFYLAILFIILMIVHIVLHWNWIKNYLKTSLGFSYGKE